MFQQIDDLVEAVVDGDMDFHQRIGGIAISKKLFAEIMGDSLFLPASIDGNVQLCGHPLLVDETLKEYEFRILYESSHRTRRKYEKEHGEECTAKEEWEVRLKGPGK